LEERGNEREFSSGKELPSGSDERRNRPIEYKLLHGGERRKQGDLGKEERGEEKHFFFRFSKGERAGDTWKEGGKEEGQSPKKKRGKAVKDLRK